MKHFYFTLSFLLTTSIALAQIPANYYDSANGLSGYTLKTELKTIITNGHIDKGYGGLLEAYKTTDRDLYYENDNTILDIYSENPSGADPYNFTISKKCGTYKTEGDCYNREHLVPQSSFNKGYPMRSDVHHVYPTDGKVNGLRSSYPFGIVATACNKCSTSSNGSKKGSSATVGYSGIVFEPLDEFKGDVARALLYFATRYEDTVDGYTSFDMFNGTKNQVFHGWALNMLLDWHNNIDPVDQRDIDRNNAAYKFQGNRNPFIDHPEYANMIWSSTADTEAPTIPTNLVASNPTSSSVNLSWTASTDNITVTSYDIYTNGTFYVTTNSNTTNFTVTGLTPKTTYAFTILAKDTSGNISTLSNLVNGTTIAGSSSSSSPTNELFFSEYMEGSSYNKALEIANFTGTDITDLSAYELRLSSNGKPTWTTTYNFPSGASILNNNVYVIANKKLAVCTGVVDESNNSITGFNGDDVIGLFKNGTLIDILGTLGNRVNFGKNTTLVRNPSITKGNTIFDINEWTTSASNTCTNLGKHSQTQILGIAKAKINELKIYPNPVKGTFLTIKVTQNTQFEIYDILGKKILKGNVTPNNNNISLSSLNKGVYIIQLKDNQGSISKKLIRQ